MCCSISSPAFSSRLTPMPNSLVALDLTLWSRLTQQLRRKPSTCFCWVTFLPAYQVDSIHKRDPWNSREDMKEEREVCRQEWWALEVGSFPLKAATELPELASEISPLGWHLPANTLPSHCSLIRANPLELYILEWFLLKCILGGRRWWLKGSSGKGLGHADLSAVLTGPELLSGQFGWLVTEKAAVCIPAWWNLTAVFAVGQ